ncbi:FAD:protein FMN transferase [Anatilimnocola floriformis]|uniref:FAD:protein FMN transferase n=1 Tax=Anatilimnocola floriformis TaxID=2948575 RepID=UPI0020C2DAA1|nr:FAD:protein FMN transferase [Anatilimnocola floriformis]
MFPKFSYGGFGVLIAALLLARFSAAAEPERFSQTQPHMGVEFEVIVYAVDDSAAKNAIAAAFQRIAELDKKLSDYSLTSELSLLSGASPTAEPVKLSDDLFTVLHAAQLMAVESDGAFDVTIGPLTKLWRRARRQKELPDAELLKQAFAAVGHRNLVVDSRATTALLKKPGMRLDLGAIAKGFAADEALAVLQKQGFKQALVRASGDIAAGEPPPQESGWKVGLAPLNPDDPPTVFVSLRNQAVSTSGEARQHLVVNGKRYSHLIDPRTGQPTTGRTSVTVIGPRGIDTDSLDSAIAILGPEKGLKLIAGRKDTHAYIVTADDDGGNVRTLMSPGFPHVQD